MVDIIVVVIVILLFGGFIYLLYLPFKRRFIKSGKLTNKLNRQINRLFILFLLLIGTLLYCFKYYRLSDSKNRLENISNIKLSAGFNVLKDEYEDMLQDYCILYDIRIDNNSTTELIKNIKRSKFYNANAFHKGAWEENDFITVDTVKAVWSKSPKGYDFSRQDGLTSYHIEFDTLTTILKYNECGD